MTGQAVNPHPQISVGVINYNGREVIEETLRSIFESDYKDIDVLVVDDGSTDDGLDIVREKFPTVRVFEQPRNMGPNAARNRVIKEARNEIVFVSDNDITLAPDCLGRLVDVIMSDNSIGVATPMVLDAERRDMIYSNGVGLHFTCFGVIPDRHTPVTPGMDLSPRPSVCGSGGIMMTRKSVAEAFGGFDEDFIFGYDDGEYTFRVTAAGRKVMQVPAARIYHIEKPGRRSDRLRYQIRGRWDLILKTYSLKTLVLLSPALALFELANFLFLALKGLAGEWLRGVWMVISGLGGILRKRKTVMSMKRVSDAQLLSGGEIYMFPSHMGGGLIPALKNVFEKFLNLYWAAVRPFLG